MDSISSCNYKDVQLYIDRFPGCTWKRFSNKPLGKGVSGVVYQICCDDYCENIVKVIQRKTSDIEKFKKTVKKDKKRVEIASDSTEIISPEQKKLN